MSIKMSGVARLRRAAVIAVVTGGVVTVAAPVNASYDGCWSGQVGLYKQSGGGGHCYGFSGTNNSFASWGLNDEIRSGKNIGTSGYRARIHRNTFHSGGVGFCIPRGAESNNPSAPSGESNDWASGTC
jgi:hypothetical protein